MKNFNFLRFAVVFAFLGILLGSCTKDRLKDPGTQVSKQNSKNDPVPATTMGSIKANIVATGAACTSLVAINNDNGSVSDEVFTDENGNVILTSLDAGNYTVIAHAYYSVGQDDQPTDTLNDVTITITDVVVTADQVTNLGIITFD